MGIQNNQDQGFKRGKNYLFVIGIDRYSYIDSLSNPVRDAKQVIEVLCGKYDFHPTNVFTLFDKKATRISIMKQFRTLGKKLNKNDNLVVYYAGHGIFDEESNEGYWLSVDTQFDGEGQFLDQSIGNDTLKSLLKSIKARHIFLISDSCFSGSFFANERSIAAEREEQFPSRWGLTSGRNEAVQDGNPNDNSPFAKSLITFLQEANRAAVQVSDIIQHVKEATAANAEQTPIGRPIDGIGHQNGEFILRLKLDEEQVWKEVCEQNSITAYEDYIGDYPEGNYFEEAQTYIYIIRQKEQEDVFWRFIIEDPPPSQASLKDFLKKFPEGQYRMEALKMLRAIQNDERNYEEEIWKKVRKEGKLEAYEKFIKEHPKGYFKKKAQEFAAKKRFEKISHAYQSFFTKESDDFSSFWEKHSGMPANRSANYEPSYYFRKIIGGLVRFDPSLRVVIEDMRPRGDKHQIMRIIITQFPWMIRAPLEYLIFKPGATSLLSFERLRQIQSTFQKSMQLFCYILMANLWDEKIKGNPVFIADELASTLDTFFKIKESTFLNYDYGQLFLCLIHLMDSNEVPFFVSEMEVLIKNDAFKKTMQFFKDLNSVFSEIGSESESLTALIETAEYYLTIHLGTIGFITQYKFLSVREVAIKDYNRAGEVIFEIKAGFSKPSYTSHPELNELIIKPFFLPPNSILLFKDIDLAQDQFIQLSPFIIDNASFLGAHHKPRILLDLQTLSYMENDNFIFHRCGGGDADDITSISSKQNAETEGRFRWYAEPNEDQYNYQNIIEELNEVRTLFDKGNHNS